MENNMTLKQVQFIVLNINNINNNIMLVLNRSSAFFNFHGLTTH